MADDGGPPAANRAQVMRAWSGSEYSVGGDLRSSHMSASLRWVTTRIPRGHRQQTHGHARLVEFTVVLAGEIVVGDQSGEEIHLGPHDAVVFAPGGLHWLANRGIDEAVIGTVQFVSDYHYDDAELLALIRSDRVLPG